jgi:hypothetical protein
MKQVNFHGYTIKEDGTILNKNGSVKSPYKIARGYFGVSLWYNGKYNKHYVHRLVAENFLDGTNETVNHKDGDKSNNHASNLEWMSYSDNNKHARETGLSAKIYEKKYVHYERAKIAGMYKTGRYKQQELCALFGISEMTLRKYIREFE